MARSQSGSYGYYHLGNVGGEFPLEPSASDSSNLTVLKPEGTDSPVATLSSQRRKLRHREGSRLAEGHTVKDGALQPGLKSDL